MTSWWLHPMSPGHSPPSTRLCTDLRVLQKMRTMNRQKHIWFVYIYFRPELPSKRRNVDKQVSGDPCYKYFWFLQAKSRYDTAALQHYVYCMMSHTWHVTTHTWHVTWLHHTGCLKLNRLRNGHFNKPVSTHPSVCQVCQPSSCSLYPQAPGAAR